MSGHINPDHFGQIAKGAWVKNSVFILTISARCQQVESKMRRKEEKKKREKKVEKKKKDKVEKLLCARAQNRIKG